MNLRKIVAFFFRSPPRAVLLSFIIAILFGSVLLQAPQATVSPGKLSFCDALFTSTSATCVTGLTVADTGSQFTKFGQIIILIMIQIGGLGIMTISTFFIYLISGKINIFECEVIFDIISQNPIRNLRRFLKTVFIYPGESPN
jgi:trk system potassium uptake protein TrkH